jgi:hypothetical protein
MQLTLEVAMLKKENDRLQRQVCSHMAIQAAQEFMESDNGG